MHDGVLVNLRCPVCRDGLTAPTGAAARTLRCPRGHSFDRARQGYVDLTAGRVTHDGDSADMVAAREVVLGAGHFDPVANAVAGVIPPYPTGLVVEVGAGTGHYLAAVLAGRPGLTGLAVDVSKPALRRAARAHDRMVAVRADVWRGLPVADGSAVAVLDIFAPRSGAEFHRVLRSDGVLVVATPGPDHLVELVDALGLLRVDPDKRTRLVAELDPWFDPVDTLRHAADLCLSHPHVAALVGMGPSARHLDPGTLASRIAVLPEPFAVTASVQISVWRSSRGTHRET